MCQPCYEKWWHKNKSRWRELHRARNYGLSQQEYDDMVIEQHGLCAICGELAKTLVVDHDHATGVVRGLLCATCNTGLGMFGDDARVLRAAVAYVEL